MVGRSLAKPASTATCTGGSDASKIAMAMGSFRTPYAKERSRKGFPGNGQVVDPANSHTSGSYKEPIDLKTLV